MSIWDPSGQSIDQDRLTGLLEFEGLDLTKVLERGYACVNVECRCWRRRGKNSRAEQRWILWIQRNDSSLFVNDLSSGWVLGPNSWTVLKV